MVVVAARKKVREKLKGRKGTGKQGEVDTKTQLI